MRIQDAHTHAQRNGLADHTLDERGLSGTGFPHYIDVGPQIGATNAKRHLRDL